MNLPRLRFRVPGHRRRPSLLWAAARVAAFWLVALPLLVLGNPQGTPEASDSKSGNAAPAAVQRVKLLLDKGSPALEIVTTAPVNPQIGKADDAMRLVIELPNTAMSVPHKLVPVKSRDLSELRLNLRNTTPPTVHIEVDFKRPLGYTWDSAGNRLLVRFHEPTSKETSATSAPAAGDNPVPVSAPAAAPNFANVVPAERLASGASITADSETTVLRLKRGGDVYICPRTTVSLMHSRNGPDLMLAINGGGLETHLTLRNSADELVTPDFRILLRGPGEFHYAIRADSRGNTCVRTLPGNTSSAIIYELMGDGKFEVQPGDQFVFHNGRLSPRETPLDSESKNAGYGVLPVECGCPPPSLASPTLLASRTPERQILPNASEEPARAPQPPADPSEATPDATPTSAGSQSAPNSAPPPDKGVQITDLPQSLREQPHVSVEASLTFTPNPMVAARHLPASSRQQSPPLTVLPPPPPAVPAKPPETHKTVFGKIKSFFSRAFH